MIGLWDNKKNEIGYLLFEVTSQCNLRCLYCYNHWKRPGEVAPAEVPYQKAHQLLTILFKSSKVSHITFTGGEPLLYERLVELILLCRMKGATVSVITNGQTGNSLYLSRLIRLGVQLFQIPVHSPTAPVHDQMTQSLGSWYRSVQTATTISQLGGKVIPVIVITKLNFNLVGETLELLHSRGFNRVMINRYNIGGQGMVSAERVMPSPGELNVAFSQANDAALRLQLELSSNVCTPHCVVLPTDYPYIAFSNCSSDLAQRPLTLSAHGEVRFCNHSPSVLGNLYQNTVAEIIKMNRNRYNTFVVPEYCTRCTIYEKCRGGCRAASEQAGKGFDQVDPLVYQKEVEPMKIQNL